jgi:hypothetical protein
MSWIELILCAPAKLIFDKDVRSLMGVKQPPDFVQVPHHGSRRNVTPSVLDRLLGPKVSNGHKQGTAFVSVGKDKPEFPRGQVKNAVQRRGLPGPCHARRDQDALSWAPASQGLDRLHPRALRGKGDTLAGRKSDE